MTAIVSRRYLLLSVWLTLAASAPVWAQEPRPANGFPAAAAASVPVERPAPPVAEPAAVPAGEGFSDLFRHIGRDFRSLPERDHLVWLGVGAALSAAGHGADRSLTRTLSANDQVEDALEPGRVIGGAMVQLGAPLLTYAVGRWTGRPVVAHLGGDLFRAQVLAQGLTQGIKLAAGRTRPDGTKFSFPSGHTASAFASATVLERHFGWKVGIPAYGLAGYVAASRLSENRHFLSDVIFGAAIGVVAGRTVTIGHGNVRFAVTPVAVPRGAAVQFVRLSR